jgi:hypothetical protein
MGWLWSLGKQASTVQHTNTQTHLLFILTTFQPPPNQPNYNDQISHNADQGGQHSLAATINILVDRPKDAITLKKGQVNVTALCRSHGLTLSVY